MFPIRDDAPRAGRVYVTPLLIVANIAVFVLQWRLPAERAQALVHSFGLRPAAFLGAWRDLAADPGAMLRAPGAFLAAGLAPLFASMFLHAGPLHLFANMFFLRVFGDNVEARLGALRYFAFYLACGIAAGLAHALTLPSSPLPAVGASGAIAGCLGAYLLLFPKARILFVVPVFVFLTFLELPAWVALPYWFALQLPWVQGALGFLGVEGVAWWAHVGGFLAGMALIPLFAWGRAKGGRADD